MQVVVMDVEIQRKLARKMIGKRKTISLDAFFEGDFNANTSRVFTLAGPQHKAESHCERPGTHMQPFSDLEPGDYILVEDDTVTGKTIERVRNRLPRGVTADVQIIMSDFSKTKGSTPTNLYYDVVDLRDFIVGSKHGGLVVYSPGDHLVRVPYMAPYVSLRTRGMIPGAKEKAVSLAMWKANVKFFQAIGDATLSECYVAFVDFAKELGWKTGCSMVDICQWHVTMLDDQNG
jgi:hypothetical protein